MPAARRCPINQAPCGPDCFIRQYCRDKPEKVLALLARLDVETAAAIDQLLAGGRRRQVKHVTHA